MGLCDRQSRDLFFFAFIPFELHVVLCAHTGMDLLSRGDGAGVGGVIGQGWPERKRKRPSSHCSAVIEDTAIVG